MDWMLFYREVDLQHYFYNGKWPIAVNPSELTPWPALGDDETPDGKAILDVALGASSRTRLFIIGRKRYHIISKGRFISE